MFTRHTSTGEALQAPEVAPIAPNIPEERRDNNEASESSKAAPYSDSDAKPDQVREAAMQEMVVQEESSTEPDQPGPSRGTKPYRKETQD